MLSSWANRDRAVQNSRSRREELCSRGRCAPAYVLLQGASGTLCLCTGSAGEPQMSWRQVHLLAALRALPWFFSEITVWAKKAFCRRCSTKHICLVVLGETAKAEGLCLLHRKFGNGAPTHPTDVWRNVSLTTHTKAVLVQGLYLLQQS